MEHLWWALGTAGPLARSVLDSALVYDVIRGTTARRPVHRRRSPRPRSPRPPRAEPGRLRIGWSTKPQLKGSAPDPAHVAGGAGHGPLLADLGHDVREVNPRYPDATLAFVPQFFGGVRTRPTRWSTTTGWSGAPARPTGSAAGCVRGVVEWALRAGEKVAGEGQPGLRRTRRVDVLLTPTIAQRPRRVGVLDKGGAVRAALDARSR